MAQGMKKITVLYKTGNADALRSVKDMWSARRSESEVGRGPEVADQEGLNLLKKYETGGINWRDLIILNAKLAEAKERSQGTEFVLGDTYRGRMLIGFLKEMMRDPLIALTKGDSELIMNRTDELINNRGKLRDLLAGDGRIQSAKEIHEGIYHRVSGEAIEVFNGLRGQVKGDRARAMLDAKIRELEAAKRDFRGIDTAGPEMSFSRAQSIREIIAVGKRLASGGIVARSGDGSKSAMINRVLSQVSDAVQAAGARMTSRETDALTRLVAQFDPNSVRGPTQDMGRLIIAALMNGEGRNKYSNLRQAIKDAIDQLSGELSDRKIISIVLSIGNSLQDDKDKEIFASIINPSLTWDGLQNIAGRYDLLAAMNQDLAKRADFKVVRDDFGNLVTYNLQGLGRSGRIAGLYVGAIAQEFLKDMNTPAL